MVAGVPLLVIVDTDTWHCEFACPEKGYTVDPPLELKDDDREYAGWFTPPTITFVHVA